jgi:hypothetical protein
MKAIGLAAPIAIALLAGCAVDVGAHEPSKIGPFAQFADWIEWHEASYYSRAMEGVNIALSYY